MIERFLRLLGLRRRAQEIHDEVQHHLQMRAEHNAAEGLTPREASLRAQRQFGSTALIEEDTRAIHHSAWLTALAQDVRYGLRGFRRAPVFTLTAVLTLALGVGASTAVFGVVDRILFRPLPYPQADRLVSIGMLTQADTNEFLTAASYLRFRDRQTPFIGMAAFGFISPCDLTEAGAVRLRCARVDSSFPPTFGIAPLAGRNFSAQDDTPHAPRTALLAYSLWMSRYAGDGSIIGKSIPIDEQPTTIIGILPPDFELFNLSPVDLLLPAALLPDENLRAVRVFARLKPGVTVEQAHAALEPSFGEEARLLPPQFRPSASLVVRPLRDRQIADVRTASWALMGAVILVLLIACANVANLLLARSAARRRELAVRHALGAGRARLVRQTLTESLLLGLLGAFSGALLARSLLRVFIAIAPNGIPRLDQATLDTRVLLFTAAVSVISAILFGLAPALERPHAEALCGGRSIASFRGFLRQSLIAVQIAASLILLTGASLLLRTLWQMEHLPLGLNPDQVVAARFVLSRSYRQARVLAFYEGLESRLSSLPLAAFAITDSVPPFGGTGATPLAALRVEAQPPLPPGAGGGVSWRYVTPGYFAALSVPILRGRPFNEQDRAPEGSAIILNQALADRLFPGSDPIGRRLFPSREGVWHTVVGVVGDVRNRGLSQPATGEYYVVRKHAPDEIFGDGSGARSAGVLVRSSLEPDAIARMLRTELAGLDPTLPVQIETMHARIRGMTDGPRFNTMLIGAFGITGLALAAIGIYGVIAFLVSRRTREVGIRLALGATPSMVTGLFVRRAAWWTTAGLCLGIAGSIAAVRLARTLLFGFGALDWWSLAASSGVLATAALAAAWLPARRAARIDPVAALRAE